VNCWKTLTVAPRAISSQALFIRRLNIMEKRITNHESFLEMLKGLGTPWEIQNEEKYQGNEIPITVKCGICGNITKKTPKNLKKDRGCQVCHINKLASNLKYSKEEIVEKINQLDPSYEIIDFKNYSKTHDDVLMKHKTCGLEYKISPNEFIYTGRRCSVCNTYLPGSKSSGENKISSWLKKYNFDYIEQVEFDDLVYTNKLKLDFLLKDFNIAIEYDGKQHFQAIGSSERALLEFEKQKERDNTKDQWCEKHSIKMIRISYKDDVYAKLKNEMRRFNDYRKHSSEQSLNEK
jgi:very-short-patch-repair endonuclease